MRNVLNHEDPTKPITADLKAAAVIGLILVFPFMLLEWVTRRDLPGSFPIPLFIFLWVLPVAFVVLIFPIVRTVRAGNSVTAKPLNLLLRVAFLILIAALWAGAFVDQLPCFVGVPNCD